MGTVNQTTIAAASIVNTDIAASAGISASKLQTQHTYLENFGFEDDAAPTAATVFDFMTFIARGNGTLQDFVAFAVDTGTTSDMKFDLLVNGSSVLTATVDLTNATADATVQAGTISSASIVAGDYVSMQLDCTTSTGVQGACCQVMVDFDYV